MALSPPTLKRAGTTLGYGVLGTVGTAAIALVVLNLVEPLQPLVYDLFYLQIGPSKATETAILVHFLLSGVVALGMVTVAGDYLTDRGANRRAIGVGFGVMLALVIVFLLVALAGLAAFLTALVVLAVACVAIPYALRYRYGVRSGAMPAFVGGVPVLVGLLFLAGFGVGWGWGYIVIAEEVPASQVDGAPVDLGDVPDVRDDLLVTGDCEMTAEDRRRCYLQLRGYEHELAAVRFMAQHDVRCPYQNTHTGAEDAFTAEHDGTYYRVTCSPHGD